MKVIGMVRAICPPCKHIHESCENTTWFEVCDNCRRRLESKISKFLRELVGGK